MEFKYDNDYDHQLFFLFVFYKLLCPEFSLLISPGNMFLWSSDLVAPNSNYRIWIGHWGPLNAFWSHYELIYIVLEGHSSG